MGDENISVVCGIRCIALGKLNMCLMLDLWVQTYQFVRKCEVNISLLHNYKSDSRLSLLVQVKMERT